MPSINVDQKCSGLRLDIFLTQQGIYNSRSQSAKSCQSGYVKVNSNIASKSIILNSGDVVEFVSVSSSDSLKGEKIDFNVVYEDKFLLVLSKPAGLVCHPAPGHCSSTLVNGLIYYCGAKNLCNIADDGKRLGIVHRLDADTSGLMIVAKTNEVAYSLVEDLKRHDVLRKYKALVYGRLSYKTGKIDVPLLRVVNSRPKMIASDDPKAKNAVTTFKVIQNLKCEKFNNYSGDFTLLDCKLHTGRTHQIRSHLEYIGYPVVGDSLYCNNSPKKFDTLAELNLNRQFLHSYKIGFVHPVYGKYLEFEDKLPTDLSQVIEYISS